MRFRRERTKADKFAWPTPDVGRNRTKSDKSESPYKSRVRWTGQSNFVLHLSLFIAKTLDFCEKWRQRSTWLRVSSSNWPSAARSRSEPATSNGCGSSRNWWTCCTSACRVTGIFSSRPEDGATESCASTNSQAPTRWWWKRPKEPTSHTARWLGPWRWACGSIPAKWRPKWAKMGPSFRWLSTTSSGRTSAHRGADRNNRFNVWILFDYRHLFYLICVPYLIPK